MYFIIFYSILSIAYFNYFLQAIDGAVLHFCKTTIFSKKEKKYEQRKLVLHSCKTTIFSKVNFTKSVVKYDGLYQINYKFILSKYYYFELSLTVRNCFETLPVPTTVSGPSGT